MVVFYKLCRIASSVEVHRTESGQRWVIWLAAVGSTGLDQKTAKLFCAYLLIVE